MKTIKQLLITIAVLLCSITVYAYDFEVDGIYYNIISLEDLTVEVTNGYNKYSGEVIIPETVVYGSKVLNVTSIREEAFSNCSNLASIVIGNSVTSMGKGTFSYCSSLESVVIGNSVTSIGEDAFLHCSSLESVVIGNSVTSIGEGAFSHCSSLDSIVIGNSVTSIGSFAFNQCFSLTNIVIGNSVTSIGEYAFYYCNLTSIEIPNSVINIENNAFDDCSSLKELRIEDGTETLSLGYNEYYIYGVGDHYEGLFSNCHLEILYLGRNLSHSSYYTPFGDNETLTYVTIGNNVTSISEEAFSNCSSLASVVIGNSVTSIGEEAFSNCSNLASVVIGNSVTSMGKGTFSYCSSLESVVIGNGVTSIGEDAFSNCSNLDSIVIGNSVTNIEDYAFYGCSELESIYLMTIMPPSVRENNFTNKNYINTILHIPHGSLATYQDATTWKNFWDIKEFYIDKYFYIRYFVDNVLFETDSIKHGSEIVLVDEPTKEGCTFSGWSGIPETMPAEDITVTGSFIPNNYAINYIVDGEVYDTDSIPYGSEIILIDEATKEGYTFSGWSEIPETMPAHDVTVTGSFSINSYDLVYMIDGEEYKQVTLEFGSEIVPEEEPTKEGYTFSGWSEIPETMPAQDVEVTGSFSINSYDLVYMIDGEEYKRVTLEFGSEIIPEEEPEKKGYTFSGWSEIPETMPAEDVTVTGSFSINSYDLVYMVDNEEYKRVTLEFGSEIVPEEEPEKEGYTFSAGVRFRRRCQLMMLKLQVVSFLRMFQKLPLKYLCKSTAITSPSQMPITAPSPSIASTVYL